MRIIVFGILCSIALFAQQSPDDQPRFLLFGGGSAFRVHASGAEAGAVVGVPDFELEQRNLNFNLYGWNAALTENIKPWFGADVDFSGQYGTPSPTFLCSVASVSKAVSCLSTGSPLAPVSTKLHTFTFGPRFTMHRFEHFRPYFHVLVGYANVIGSLQHSAIFLPSATLLPQGYSKSESGFAIAPGGGVDLPLSSRFAVRLFELDYFMTRFYGQRQDNARLSAGVVFQFRGKSY
jgi:hypothetical protein